MSYFFRVETETKETNQIIECQSAVVDETWSLCVPVDVITGVKLNKFPKLNGSLTPLKPGIVGTS